MIIYLYFLPFDGCPWSANLRGVRAAERKKIKGFFFQSQIFLYFLKVYLVIGSAQYYKFSIDKKLKNGRYERIRSVSIILSNTLFLIFSLLFVEIHVSFTILKISYTKQDIKLTYISTNHKENNIEKNVLKNVSLTYLACTYMSYFTKSIRENTATLFVIH